MRIGSIVAARHAGISTAQQPTTASAIIEDVRETGLHRLLPVQAAIGRWSIATSTNPPPIPSAIVLIAEVKMSPRMRAFDAPNAMRSANSRVRSETAHATTLEMPTAARARANAAHAENRDAANCGRAHPFSQSLSSRLEEAIRGCSAFTSATFRFSLSVIPPGAPEVLTRSNTAPNARNVYGT